jgi:hypothetical protein
MRATRRLPLQKAGNAKDFILEGQALSCPFQDRAAIGAAWGLVSGFGPSVRSSGLMGLGCILPKGAEDCA